MEAERLVELQGKKEEEGRNQRRREESFYFGERKTRFFGVCFPDFFCSSSGISGLERRFLSSSSSSGRYCCAGGGKKMRCYSSASFPLPHLELIKF